MWYQSKDNFNHNQISCLDLDTSIFLNPRYKKYIIILKTFEKIHIEYQTKG